MCGFGTSIREGLKLTVEGCTDARCKKNILCCSNPGCNIIAHVHSSGENKRFIFNVPCFIGKTCYEIAHNDTFRGMFAETNNLIFSRKRQLAGDIDYTSLLKSNTYQLFMETTV